MSPSQTPGGFPGEIEDQIEAAQAGVAAEAEAYLADAIKAGLDQLAALPDDQFFIDKKYEGLQVVDAAAAIKNVITYGWNPTSKEFQLYVRGRWPEGDHLMERAVVMLLGNRYRPGHKGALFTALRHLSGVPEVNAEPVEPDTLINLLNGLLEWRTGRLLPHVPERCGITQLNALWRPGLTGPNVDKFLSEVLEKDCLAKTEECPEGFIWEVIAYAMFSGNPLHKAFLLKGAGRNGKGRFLHLLRVIAGLGNLSAVTLHDLLSNRFKITTLYGKLLNVAGDMDSSYLNETALFKAVTGGDVVQGEKKFGHPYDFAPWATPFYSMNRPFSTSDDSVGFWDRWIMIHFPRNFSGSGKLDSEIDNAITSPEELSGVLNKAIPALRTLMDRGRFLPPKSCEDLKQEFRRYGDKALAWVADRCRLDLKLPHISRSVLYDSFKIYVEQDGGKPMSRQRFYERLEKVPGVRSLQKDGIRGFTGISTVPNHGHD